METSLILGYILIYLHGARDVFGCYRIQKMCGASFWIYGATFGIAKGPPTNYRHDLLWTAQKEAIVDLSRLLSIRTRQHHSINPFLLLLTSLIVVTTIIPFFLLLIIIVRRRRTIIIRCIGSIRHWIQVLTMSYCWWVGWSESSTRGAGGRHFGGSFLRSCARFQIPEVGR